MMAFMQGHYFFNTEREKEKKTLCDGEAHGQMRSQRLLICDVQSLTDAAGHLHSPTY